MKLPGIPTKFQTDYITIKGFQEKYYFNSNGSLDKIAVLAVNYGNFNASSSKAVLHLVNQDSSRGKINLDFETIKATIAAFYKDKVEAVKYIVSYALAPCDTWYNNELSNEEIQRIVDIVSRRSPCPPSVPNEFPDELPNFILDSSCQPKHETMCAIFHHGAKGCYRSTNNKPDNYASQCCYDFNNNLILSLPAGGTLDMVDSSESWREHFLEDVIPYIWCCIKSSKCEKYYEKRPIVDSKYFAPPRVVRGNGDPHFMTMDGLTYSFNSVGEFIYLASGSDVIQVRMSQLIDRLSTQPMPACYFSAFVFKSGSSDVIQVELNSLQLFTFRINGQTVGLDLQSYEFIGISINFLNNDTCTLRLSSGIVAEIKQISHMLHIILTVPNHLKAI